MALWPKKRQSLRRLPPHWSLALPRRIRRRLRLWLAWLRRRLLLSKTNNRVALSNSTSRFYDNRICGVYRIATTG